MKTNVAVVIPNWNGADFLRDCLDSLMNQTHPGHIIVVDNGSTDESLEIITEFSGVELISLEENIGFAGGVNRGIERALDMGCEYIALFNNDAVAEQGWLKELLKAADAHEDAGIVTGKFMKLDKKHIDSTGDFCRTDGMPSPRGRGQTDTGQFDSPEYVFGATGGSSLYRAHALREIGIFDEDFFAYFEDVDISFRAQLAGWMVWYQPTAVSYHRIGGTSSRLGSFARYHSIKNYIYLYNKNMPSSLFWKYKPLFFVRLARMFAGSVRDGEFFTFLRAFLAAVLATPKTLTKRRHIQSSRKVEVSYIESLLKQGNSL